MSEGKRMEKHVLQWHITHRCNLRCLHCYQEDYQADLPYDQLEKIFLDYLSYIKAHHFKGHINVTGGEPLLHPDFFKLLDLFEAHQMSFGILTNGTLLEEEQVRALSKYKCLSFVQISIDGMQRMHDRIRGKGNFQKAKEAIKRLNQFGIPSMVAFTAHQKNWHQLPKVIRFAKKNKVKIFWADRLIPTATFDKVLTNEQFMKMSGLLWKEAWKAKQDEKCVTEIRVNRALMFLGGADTIYHCSAGVNLLAVLANGDLLPCRRLPIKIGNVLENSMENICRESALIRQLNEERIPKECESCYRAVSGGTKMFGLCPDRFFYEQRS